MKSRGPAMEAPRVALEARDVCKRFGGTQALSYVSIEFARGEVHAIVGENGAGKSTLVKILSGFYPSGSYEGELLIDGDVVHVGNLHGAEEQGIFLVPQDIQIVPEMTISENLFLNREPQRFGFVKRATMLAEAAKRLREFGLVIDPSRPISSLTAGEQQLVVIARAMMRKVKVLALDEPTAALSDAEAQVLFQHIERLRQHGISVIYISHRLDEIIRIAQRVTVLRDGRVAERLELAGAIDAGRRIVRAMVGRDLQLTRRTPAKIGKCRLSVSALSVDSPRGRSANRSTLEDVSFDVHEGEVLGIFGSVGSGSDELAHALFGLVEHSKDTRILVDGAPRRPRGASDAMTAGIGYLPGDRQRNAAFSYMNVGENISILTLDALSRGGLIRAQKEADLVHDYFRRFRIKAQSSDIAVSTLSGGNQQKVMLARILSRNPSVLILHEPTQGVDIATKQDVYGVVDKLANEGKATVVVSTDLEEILTVSDRILILKQGRCVGIWDRTATQDDLLAAATGGA